MPSMCMTRTCATLLALGAVLSAAAPAWAQPAATLGAELTANTGTAVSTAAEASAPEPAQGTNQDTTATDRTREQDALRVSNTWLGSSGGLHVVDAGSGLPATFRLQLGLDAFSTNDFLVEGDHDGYLGGTLSLSYTPVEHLELFGALSSHANTNNRDEPQLMQVIGDGSFGAKGYALVAPVLTVGGDLRFVVPSAVGSVGPLFAAVSVGLRGNASVDLRRLTEPIPLLLRGSVDYLFDNTASLIDDVEAERYLALGPDRNPPATEQRHLVRRVERFALGINRTDALTFALGVEAPLQASDSVYLHPLLEWSLSVPINRQGYSCLLVATDASRRGEDGCLDIEGLAAMPSTLTLGLRAYPGLAGLSFSAGLDVGLTGTSTFVRELAPNRPYAVLLALAYAVDAREKPAPTPIEVVREVQRAAPEQARVHGVVIDSGTGAGIGGARVDYPAVAGVVLTAQQTDTDGSFVSYGVDPGTLHLAVSHPDYEPGTCSVEVPAQPSNTPPQGAAPPPSAPPQDAPLSVRCELTARPRLGALTGRVVAGDGLGIASASLELQGPSTLRMTTDSLGQFAQLELQAGSYTVRAEAPAYLLRQTTIEIKAGQTATLELALVEKPKEAQVELTTQEVRIRKQVFFKSNSAEISDKSNQLLSEIADVLLRNPQVTLVEIQGHTDNRGSPDINRALSQARAEAVRTWLIGAGVDSGRLTAKGYGDERPLVLNLTERTRARNRRVQLVIREQH